MTDTAEVTREASPPAFAFTDEHDALRAVLADFFANPRADWRGLLDGVGADEIVFDTGACTATATAIDLAILAEQAGAALFGGPLLPGVAAGALAAHLDDASLVAPLRDGTATAGYAATPAELTTAATGGITAVAQPVWHGPGAERVVLVGTLDGAPAVALVTGVAGAVQELSGLDLSRSLGTLAVTDIRPAVLLRGDEAADAAAAIARRTGLVTAAELLGVAQYVLDATVEYVDKRVQFGRTIGSFQAIKHRLVDLLAGVELTRSAVYGAAWRLTEAPTDPGTDIDLAVAAVLSRRTALAATKAAVQLHGGIAITWEHWAHRYLRRANSTVSLTGSPSDWRQRLAGLIDRRDGHGV